MNDENTQSEPPVEAPIPVVADVSPPVSEQIPPAVEPANESIEPAPDVSHSPARETAISATEEPSTIPAVMPISEPVTTVTDQTIPVQSVPASAPLTPLVPQPQSPTQQDQTGFIRALLAKANAKLHSNRQKKLDILMLMAQKKRIITNDDVQKLLRVSDATATRYLVKLVQQGHLARAGNPRDAKYQFLR